jgi:hypothetical protein
VEGGAAAPSLSWVGDGFSRGVVVVAELFVVQAGAAAAVAVGEDVAALEAFRCFGFRVDDGVWHMSPPLGEKVYKVFKRKDLSPYFGRQVLRLKAKARLVHRASFLSLLLL